ncbi:MAG: carbon-nitrogen hydrolase family protein [Thermacetogeniaceae bacterium]
MTGLKLAIIQFPREKRALEPNISKMKSYLKGVAPDTDVVLLPENWLGSIQIEWSDYQKVVLQMLECLQASKALLVSGAQYIRTGSYCLERGMFISKESSAPVVYEKLFPSQPVGERGFLAPGSKSPVISHKGVLLGAAVCVDLFYPEVIRSLALRGALLVVNPANIPVNRIGLWQQIGVVRACENTIFVAMANNTCTCYSDHRQVMGGSFVAYPDGFNLISFGNQPGVYYAELDLDVIQQVRQRWPYLEDIRNRKHLITERQGKL